MQDVGCEAQDVGCRVWSVGSRGWDARDKEGVDEEEAFFGEPGSLPPGVQGLLKIKNTHRHRTLR